MVQNRFHRPPDSLDVYHNGSAPCIQYSYHRARLLVRELSNIWHTQQLDLDATVHSASAASGCDCEDLHIFQPGLHGLAHHRRISYGKPQSS
jgi:hypothetical protein